MLTPDRRLLNLATLATPATPATAVLLAALALFGCAGHDAGAAVDRVAPDSASAALARQAAADSTRAEAAAPPAVRHALELQRDPAAIVRGLYLNRFAVQYPRKMARLLALADSTEINAFVVDVKDEFGLNFVSADTLLRRNAGTMTKATNLAAWVDSMRAHGILPIARIVVFKDSVAARNNPDNVIRKPDGSPWRDREGLTWVNPFSNAIWEYNFRVGDEAIRLGFGEIQFDYIRFPEPYRSLPTQVFPDQRGRGKAEVLAEFLRVARARYARRGVRTTADVFGLTTTVNGTLEVGQRWEPLSAAVDVMLPMVYPSHYPRGSFGIARPNADPYRVIHTAIARARERDIASGITAPEHVRAWLQAFTLGQPPYGPEQIRAQKQAVYDAGYDGWVLWHPGSNYEVFAPAFERTTVSRKKQPEPRATEERPAP